MAHATDCEHTNMLGTRALRDRSTSRDPDGAQQIQRKSNVKDKGKEKAVMDQWVEPTLAQKPSYRDHSGGSFYGVSEHMQPLGEAPNARVKARVKADGGRKALLGKGAGGVGVDAQDTPEGTPVPQSASQAQIDTPSQPRIVVDDENDGDYAPKDNGKKKERTTRPRAVKRQDDVPPAPTNTVSKKPKSSKSTDKHNKKDDPKSYTGAKVKAVVEAAKLRALEVGKPDLAAAVNQIYIWSLDDARLMKLLQAILTQTASKSETAEFQEHVRKAKKKLREEKEAKEAARNLPENANSSQSLPLRSPSKFTAADAETSAIPSTEPTDIAKPKVSLRVKSPEKGAHRRRSAHSARMSVSPSKERSGSPGSDSSLTDMTSNPDEGMDIDEPNGFVDDTTTTRMNSAQSKDHAAERGSLAPPNRNLKRSSADAELQEEERDRVLASKKQKLNETVTRDYQYEESNIRAPTNGTAARLRSQRGKNGSLAAPLLSVPTNGSRIGSTRGSRAVSTDLDSPLSDPLTTSSRQSTPHVWKAPSKPFGKRAKTKQS